MERWLYRFNFFAAREAILSLDSLLGRHILIGKSSDRCSSWITAQGFEYTFGFAAARHAFRSVNILFQIGFAGPRSRVLFDRN